MASLLETAEAMTKAVADYVAQQITFGELQSAVVDYQRAATPERVAALATAASSMISWLDAYGGHRGEARYIHDGCAACVAIQQARKALGEAA